jgi:cation diffusion facilitator family transporter
MGADCCDRKAGELALLRESQARVLKIVLAINAGMFVLELGVGLWSGSTALLADSLDMLGDAGVYAISLYVLGRGAAWEARAAMLKGGAMLVFGVGVAADAVAKAVRDVMPSTGAMTLVGATALLANTGCLLLLLRHRRDGLNMRSTWLCSRNDVAANLGVLAAAGAVTVFRSKWPDLIIGATIALLFLRSATSILHESIAGLRAARTVT